jgi:hypothetical protein
MFKVLSEIGVPISVDSVLERFGLSKPRPDEELLRRPSNRAEATASTIALANESPLRPAFKKAFAKSLTPLSERLKAILALEGAEFEQAAKDLRSELPALLSTINSEPKSGELLAEIFGESFIAGITAKP